MKKLKSIRKITIYYIFFLINCLGLCHANICNDRNQTKEIGDCQWQDDVSSKIVKNDKTYINFFGTETLTPSLPRDAELEKKLERLNYIPEFYRGVIEYQQCGTNNKCGKRFSNFQNKYVKDWIKEQKDPVFVVIYIHGWHHNSKSDDSNFMKFNDLLARVSHQLRYKTPNKNYKTIGVYIGWQGEKNTSVIKSILTIGNRACAADVISLGINTSECKNANKSLKLQNTSDLYSDIKEIKSLLDNNEDSRLLVIGHSLGGRIVSNLFLHDAEKHPPLGSQSLISTINAAIGSERYSSLYSKKTDINYFQQPQWINITSNGDTATKIYYPLARLIGKVEGFHTIGHDSRYITHTLTSEYLGSYKCRYNKNRIPFLDRCIVKKEGENKIANNFSTFSINSDWVRNSQLRLRTFLVFPEISSYTDQNNPNNFNSIFKLDKFCNQFENENMRLICKIQGNYDSLDSMNYIVNITQNKNSIYPMNGKLWNIQTDNEFIDFRGDEGTVSGKHNGYVNSEIISMLVDRTLEMSKNSN